jgi:ribosome modulation factor
VADQEREPITDVATLLEQDRRDMMSGYLAGLHGRDEPGCEFNRAYWHGWRNGMVDSGRRQIDAAQMKLVKEFANGGGNVQTYRSR